MRCRDTVRQFIQIADRLQTRHTPCLRRITLQQPYRERCQDDRHQRTGESPRHVWHADTDQQREHTDSHCPPVHAEMLRIEDPLVDEISRHVRQAQTEEIVHLRAEDRQRDTCREANNNRVWHELDHRSQLRQTHRDQQDSRHHRRDHQTAQTVLLDDAVDDHDERTRRATDLHLTTA